MPRRHNARFKRNSFRDFFAVIIAGMIALWSHLLTNVRALTIEPSNKKKKLRKAKHKRAIVECSSDSEVQPLASGFSDLTELRPSGSGNLLVKVCGSVKSGETMTETDDLIPFDSGALTQECIALSPKSDIDDSISMSPSTLTMSLSEVTSAESSFFSPSPESIGHPVLMCEEGLRLVSTYRQPPCYTKNDYLHTLLDLMSDIFNHSECEGYVFGSTNYKKIELPHDFDILLENIQSNQDRAKVDALIQRFKEQGGVVTARDDRGIDGYRTGNRHVIPMEWKHWKLDFILSPGTVVDHSRYMDFTVGALYFNLRQKKMYRVEPFSTLSDLDRKRISTIIDPMISFSDDPSRIFRAVRLMATEGFHLAADCDYAIRTLFAGDKNPFNTMKAGKFFQQLQLMFSSGHERENIAIFYQLGLFFKLYNRVDELAGRGGYRYLLRLQPYYSGYVSPFSPQPVFFVPYIVPGFFAAPVAPWQRPFHPEVLRPNALTTNDYELTQQDRAMNN